MLYFFLVFDITIVFTAVYAGDGFRRRGVTVNLTSGFGSFADAEGDVLADIHNLVGSEYDDVLVGDAGDNR